ncbi:hypothetical protein [Maritimibacter alexandrii]|uniref:hypothetical protein n=1 Tax=Maritimibacter alexandrii TaxID=2570355 RepID=UPI001108DBB2|nr:hypothetical protein [Maritimibacter alexandrii]
MERDHDIVVEGYYEIDEFEDVIGSLKALAAAVGDNPSKLEVKWSFLAAHSALQGACVCILTDTRGLGALTRDSEKALSEYLEARSQEAMRNAVGGKPITIPLPAYPETRMANLRNLARRLPDDVRFNVANSGERSESEEDEHLTLLSRWRDEFTHYPPQSWSIEVAFVVPILETTISKIEQISSHRAYKRFNRFSETEIEALIGSIRKTLKAFKKT